jgi:acyl carrier protein
MTPEEVVGKVFDLPVHLVTDSASNTTVAEWDSLGHMTLILELEATYGVSVSAQEAMTLTDLSAIKQLLVERGVRW